MRLLHVEASYLPATRYGGTIVSVHGLCKALAARGHDVHVFTTSVNGDTDSDVPHGQAMAVDGVKVWYFRSPRLRRLYWSPGLGAALAARVRDFDVVHTHAIFLWPLWAAARAARRARVPYVVSPRGMLERDLVSNRSPLLKGLWIAGIERFNLERAAAIHVTSARETQEAAAFGFALPPIREIPNGVDLEPANGAASPSIAAIVAGDPYALFLGRLNWKKGLDRLLASLPRVPGLRLVMAGNDEDHYRPVLDDLARRFEVTGRVAFTGPVQGADKAALLAGARMLVLPSYSENFGNVVLEAMAAGCPVVVTPEVGVAGMVEDTGSGLVASGEPIALAEAMAALADDAARRAAMGARGAATVRERFTWPAVAAQMEALYESVLRERSAHA
jgi:glycosyltransferase involved in cell wall biosynthesis